MSKWHIHQEEAKTRQTSHWDWDYLPRAELERLSRRQRDARAARERRPRARRRLAWICLAAALGLLVASVVVLGIWAFG
jgi:hypothetical protein